MVLEKTLESPLDSKEIQTVHPKGNQSWIYIRRTDGEAETLILWPSDVKNWLIGKTLMLGKIEGRKRRGRQRMRWLDGITDSITWVWVGSGSWWWTGRPGVLQSMESKRVRHDWASELNWTEQSTLESTDRKIKLMGREHPWILVHTGASGTNAPWIPRDDLHFLF